VGLPWGDGERDGVQPRVLRRTATLIWPERCAARAASSGYRPSSTAAGLSSPG
jgi:hypothetical protein